MSASDNNSYHILLVEDDEVDIQCVQREFSKLKVPIKIHVAKDGVEALEMLYGTEEKTAMLPAPALIVLDINMPRMNGIELLKKLREDENFKFMKVFILTTAYTSRDKIATHDLNVTGYIVKPLQSNDVMNIYWTIIGPS